MSGHALLLAAGTPPNAAFLKRAARGAAVFICADSAYASARKAGLAPDWVVGDFDSLPKAKGGRLAPGVKVYLDDDPHSSDLDKCLRMVLTSRWSASRREPEVWVLGAFGGRPDHQLGNLQVVQRYAVHGRLRVADEHGTLEIVAGKRSFASRPGETVSIFPLGPSRVSASGLRWPLKAERMEPGSRGLSNAAVGRRFRLEIEGAVWLYRARAPWAP